MYFRIDAFLLALPVSNFEIVLPFVCVLSSVAFCCKVWLFCHASLVFLWSISISFCSSAIPSRWCCVLCWVFFMLGENILLAPRIFFVLSRPSLSVLHARVLLCVFDYTIFLVLPCFFHFFYIALNLRSCFWCFWLYFCKSFRVIAMRITECCLCRYVFALHPFMAHDRVILFLYL